MINSFSLCCVDCRSRALADVLCALWGIGWCFLRRRATRLLFDRSESTMRVGYKIFIHYYSLVFFWRKLGECDRLVVSNRWLCREFFRGCSNVLLPPIDTQARLRCRVWRSCVNLDAIYWSLNTCSIMSRVRCVAEAFHSALPENSFLGYRATQHTNKKKTSRRLSWFSSLCSFSLVLFVIECCSTHRRPMLSIEFFDFQNFPASCVRNVRPKKSRCVLDVRVQPKVFVCVLLLWFTLK